MERQDLENVVFLAKRCHELSHDLGLLISTFEKVISVDWENMNLANGREKAMSDFIDQLMRMTYVLHNDTDDIIRIIGKQLYEQA